MIFENKLFLNKYISVKDDNIKITCSNQEIKEKLEKVLGQAKNNFDNNDWDYSDYIVFCRQLTKLDVKDFEDCSEQIFKILNLNKLSNIELRLKELDKKLDLHIFEDKRYSIKQSKDSKETNLKIAIKPHVFTAADIVIFFQRLKSEINKKVVPAKNTHTNIINNCETLESKENETKLLLTLLDEKDLDICNMITEPYYEWISSLNKEDDIYIYLESKIPYVFSLYRLYLIHKINEYSKQKDIFLYLKERKSDFKANSAKKSKRYHNF